MKVVCINNIELSKDFSGKPRHKRLPLTIGQIYEVEEENIILGKKSFYFLEKDNDNVEGIIYPVHYFVTIDVWREMQINKII